jgi:hypothetical protein
MGACAMQSKRSIISSELLSIFWLPFPERGLLPVCKLSASEDYLNGCYRTNYQMLMHITMDSQILGSLKNVSEFKTDVVIVYNVYNYSAFEAAYDACDIRPDIRY